MSRTYPKSAVQAILAIDTAVLAADICTQHEAACQAAGSALEHARRCGELLAQAKAVLSHGKWLPWLAAHCSAISPRVAQGYMRIAARWDEIQQAAANAKYDSYFVIGVALRLLAEPGAAPDEWPDKMAALSVLSDSLCRDSLGELDAELYELLSWFGSRLDSPLEPTAENIRRLRTLIEVAGKMEGNAVERRWRAGRKLGELLRS